MIALAAFLGMVTPTELPRVVDAIEMAENSSWESPGGGLQFTEKTWKEETDLPYFCAKNPMIAKIIAMRRLSKHCAALEAMKVEPTAYLLGCMWNKGFVGAMRLRRLNQKCSYGERVENLFNAYTK